MDLVANMLSTIKNAAMSGRQFVEFPYSKLKEEVVRVILDKGLVSDVKVFKPSGSSFKMIHVDLKYQDGVSVLSQAKKISKPGRRIYKGSKKIKRIVGGYGISIISTSQGIMEGSVARKRRLGGEVICEVF